MYSTNWDVGSVAHLHWNFIVIYRKLCGLKCTRNMSHHFSAPNLGCVRGNQDQLCRLSNKEDIWWIRWSFWNSWTRSYRWVQNFSIRNWTQLLLSAWNHGCCDWIYWFHTRSCSSDEKTACAAICDRMGLQGYQVHSLNKQETKKIYSIGRKYLKNYELYIPNTSCISWC